MTSFNKCSPRHCFCWRSPDGYTTVQSDDPPPHVCRWRFCLLTTCLISAIVTGVALCVLFLSIVPAAIKTAGDNSVLIQKHLEIFNVTETSAQINATLQLAGTGSYPATIPAVTARVSNDEGEFGTLDLPEIHIEANKGAMLHSLSTLKITNFVIFQKSVHVLLSGKNVDWFLLSHPEIRVKFWGSTVKVKVDLNNTITLEGSSLENGQTGNLTIVSATSTSLNALADMSFSTSSALVLNIENITFEMSNMNGTLIGYATMADVELAPGYNAYRQVPTMINITSGNIKAIEGFFSAYMMGRNQPIRITGPSPVFGRKTIVDYAINQTITVLGSNAGNTAIGGLSTEESQLGWTVNLTNGTTFQVKGAYAAFKNPLNVDIQISKLLADINFLYELEYDFILNLSKITSQGLKVPQDEVELLEQGSENAATTNETCSLSRHGKDRLYTCHCGPTRQFAQMRSGPGMYQYNFSKIWIDLGPYDYQSAFLIGLPQPGQFGYPNTQDLCMLTPGLYLPCCFVGEVAAAVCYENVMLRKNINAELSQVYIPTEMLSTMTVRILHNFEINVAYNQPFFPLYYGYSVYAGYPGDFGINCENFVFYTNKTTSATPTTTTAKPTKSPTKKQTPSPTEAPVTTSAPIPSPTQSPIQSSAPTTEPTSLPTTPTSLPTTSTSLPTTPVSLDHQTYKK